MKATILSWMFSEYRANSYFVLYCLVVWPEIWREMNASMSFNETIGMTLRGILSL